MQKINQFWPHCLAILEKNLPTQQFVAWIKPLQIVTEENQLTLISLNTFAEQFIRSHFLKQIEEIAFNFFQYSINIELKVIQKKSNLIEADVTQQSVKKSSSETFKTNLNTQEHTKLNPNYTFDNLVMGKANQLAKAASSQVAEQLGQDYYNPLFIYGASGLGKTHLIHAIGNAVHKIKPEAKIRYVSAERYIKDVVKAYQHGAFEQFQKYYNSLDVLLIDDIQFFSNKEKTLDEFFNLFNMLKDANKQIVITCDTLPKEIPNIPERLKTRFGQGLTVEIEPPELEMRIAILQKKAEMDFVKLDTEIALYIAHHIKSNVRELEGALKKVVAFSKFTNQKLTMPLAKKALESIIALENRAISIESIQKTVCDFYKIKLVDLLSKKRTRNFARPRQIAMALTRELTQMSLPNIGQQFGDRDHTTVMHADKTIKELRNNDPQIKHEYNVLLQMLRN